MKMLAVVQITFSYSKLINGFVVSALFLAGASGAEAQDTKP
jgi:hypothetical protein